MTSYTHSSTTDFFSVSRQREQVKNQQINVLTLLVRDPCAGDDLRLITNFFSSVNGRIDGTIYGIAAPPTTNKARYKL